MMIRAGNRGDLKTVKRCVDEADVGTILAKYAAAATAAQSAGLGVNAGHDLNLKNLGKFCEIPGILEVSIGHALVTDALEMGFSNAVRHTSRSWK